MKPEELLQELIMVAKYTRWNYGANRRETREEMVDRVMTDYIWLGDGILTDTEIEDMRSALLDGTAFGAMRMLKMAGPAYQRSNICAFNCAAMPLDRIDCFHDLMILGMNGVGVTISVEDQFISKLPVVRPPAGELKTVYVPDTTKGWAEAVLEAVIYAYEGYEVKLDTSDVRPAGALLHTKGGRASGPEPLEEALRHVVAIIRGAAGRQLSDVELADIACWLGNATVQGGVRRVALMIIGDKDSEGILSYKSGEWYNDPDKKVRANANIDVVFDGSETQEEFYALVDKMLGNGEPSFFNRTVAYNRMSDLRKSLSSDPKKVLPNPCGEAILDLFGLCNLSVGVMRPGLSYEEMMDRVRLASIFGTLQAQGTDFPELMIPDWEQNAKRLRLCGASLTGIADTPKLADEEVLAGLWSVAMMTAEDLSERMGRATPASFTAVKPAGNTSLATNTSPGVNPRHYRYAKRRVTFKKSDPLVEVLTASGIPMEDSLMDDKNVYAVFPMAAPEGATVASEMTAIEQMERYLSVLENYSDQAVSVTIMFREEEREDIKEWLWKHRLDVTSMTFLEMTGQYYPQMIIEELTKEEYKEAVAAFPKEIKWDLLSEIEKEDYTGAVDVECAGGACSVM
jgi:ribonucleoside-diphosphate reductase alpha chain